MNGAASYTSGEACSFMTQENRAYGPAYRALILSALMLTSTALVPSISAESEPDKVWGMSGSEDTGWVQLDALGADPLNGIDASAKWNLEFAPGATLDNLTFEIRVDGANGVSIKEPMILDPNTYTPIFDWQGMGTLGKESGFEIGNPYSSRLSPNTNSNAGWSIPAGSEITDLVIEALAPADPYVAFSYLDIDFSTHAIHPVDGRMYVGVGESVIMLDSNNNPPIIDMISFEGSGGIPDLELDIANDRLYIVTYYDGVHSIALSDSSTQLQLPGNPGSDELFSEALVTPSGDLLICGSNGLFSLNSAGTGWTMEAGSGSTNWPDGFCVDLFLDNGVVYAPLWEGGVARWDLNSWSAMSAWTSDNHLPSDNVNMISKSGSQLLIATYDGGISRYDTSGGFWLSDWNDGNWLAANYVPGMQRIADTLYILAGDIIHHYNTTSGIFSTSTRLDSIGLDDNGADMMYWPAIGSRSPMNDSLLIGDGSGILAMVEHGAATFHVDDVVIGSGPSNPEMTDAVEVNNVLWVASFDTIDRYDIRAARWLSPLTLPDTITTLESDGVSVFIGTDGDGLHVYNSNGTAQDTWGVIEGTASDRVKDIALDGNHIIIGHYTHGMSIIDTTTNSIIIHDTGTGLLTDFPTDIETFGGIAYIGSEDEGLGRYDIANDTFLSSWVSTGVDSTSYAPVVVSGDILYLGLTGYGVVRKDLSTGELLDPLRASGRNGLPSNSVYSLHVNGNGDVFIGTQTGAVRWDGQNMDSFNTGSGWPRPTNFLGFDDDGTDIYAATNAGACRFDMQSLNMDTCIDRGDGLPNSYTMNVALDGSTLYAATWTGVALIETSNDTVMETWEASGISGHAIVEVIDDIAYVGLNGIGLARYDILNDEWLSLWDEASGVIEGDDITTLHKGRYANQLWIGGDMGFQVINVSTGAEIVHWEQSDSEYPASSNPYQMEIFGNTVYFRAYWNDLLYRIDLDNQSALSSLDAGQQVNLNGYTFGLGTVGDILHIGVAPWTTSDTNNGGIARFNMTNKSWAEPLRSDGQIDRVKTYQSSSGDNWVAWGADSLIRYDSTGAMTGEWDSSSLDLPIRAIVEYDGELLFGTSDGIARYDETNGQWLSTWTPGSGMDSSLEDTVYGLFSDGSDLWVGTARENAWGQFQDAEIGLLDSSGSWTTWDESESNIPSGFPTSIVECDGYIHFAMYNGWNGGVARFDPMSGSSGNWINPFTRGGNGGLDEDSPSSLACDNSDTLYVGYYANNQPISRFDYNNLQWLSDITSDVNGIATGSVYFDALHWSNGYLLSGHTVTSGNGGGGGSSGGYSVLQASGNSVGRANIGSKGSSVTDFGWTGSGWMIGIAGGSTGYSHVDSLGQLGQQVLYSKPGLVSGKIVDVVGNSTHIYVGTGSGINSDIGGILEGEKMPNGSIEWRRGWSAFGVIEDLQIDGDQLWITVVDLGLMKIDLNSGNQTLAQLLFHANMDIMTWNGDDLVIGMKGSQTSASGVQVFNTTQSVWTGGKLIAGLPSNQVNGFAFDGDIIYMASDAGIGRFNDSSREWLNPWTAADGLSTNTVEDIVISQGEMLMATANGLNVLDMSTGNLTLFEKNDGMMGQSSRRIAIRSGSPSEVFISHDGMGSDRPGVTEMSFTSSANSVVDTHRFDQLPSNNVEAMTTDQWNLYITTDESPMLRWSSSTNDFEDGPDIWSLKSSPVIEMVSDGSTVIAIGSTGATMINPTSFSVSHSVSASNINGGAIGAKGLWLATDDGLLGWHNGPAWNPMDRGSMRRAIPLNIGFQTAFTNVSMYAHPGMGIDLLDGTNVTLDSGQGSASSHGILMQAVPLVVSSTVDNAAFWIKSRELNYSWTYDLASTDPTVATSMQFIVDNGQLVGSTRHAQLELTSPSNGSIMVRMTYDWIRSETPVEILSLEDRPDDGGDALVATWSVVNDEDFSRYLIFVKEDGWANDPSAAELSALTPDTSISIASRLQSDLTTAGGLPITPDKTYRAVIVVEYNGGRLGTPSAQFGPAIPTDEIPMSPEWAKGVPAIDGEVGDLFLEWSRCTAIDLASTEIYYSTTLVTDAIGLQLAASINPAEGNQTTLSLEAGKPHWFAFTCVDDAGQEDILNATIIGPIVPTGGLNDNTPPPRLNNVWAEDVPNDEGGRVRIGWDPSTAYDCSFVTIWMMEARMNEEIPTNVNGFSEATIVPDCESNMTVVSSINGMPLKDGVEYWIGAVASDDWLNTDLGNVMVLSVTPDQDLLDSSEPPERAIDIEAWDHPDDSGVEIDISFSPSNADDFAYYIIWVADTPVDDLSATWNRFESDISNCGCLRLNKQWIDERWDPIQLTIGEALYGGEDPSEANAGLIKPGVELFVTVTIHDIKGNVHLTGLNSASVIPIDNMIDETAPDRLDNLVLVDREGDDGTAVVLDFTPAQESDISHYEVFAASYSFDSVGLNGNGPAKPVAILERTPDIPLTISFLSDGSQVIPGMKVTVVVVVVDSSDNAHRDNLFSITTEALDDGIDPFGNDLPEIKVSLSWVDEDTIEAKWNHPTDPLLTIIGYRLYISDSQFSSIDDGILVEELTATSGSMLIDEDAFSLFDNETTWWIGVAVVSEFTQDYEIKTYSIAPDGTTSGGDEKSDAENDSTQFSDYLTTQNMLASGLGLLSIILLIAILRGGRRGGSRDKEWEIQEATWGVDIQSRSEWDDMAPVVSSPPAVPGMPQSHIESTLMSGAQRIETQQQTFTQQPAQQQQPPSSSGIDTSFLDDLL